MLRWTSTRKSKLETKQLLLTAILFVLSINFINPVYSEEANNISISVQNTEINEVYEMLSREGKVNILLSSTVQGEISVNLYEVSLEKAINTITAAAGFVVEYIDGSYFIKARDDVGKDHAGSVTELKTFRVQYSDTNQIAEILNKHLSRYGKITALPDRNLLVVEELPDFISRIESLLLELDKQPKQILIEARILEISLDDTETYGIDWSRLFSINGGTTQETTGAVGTQGLSLPGSPGFFFSLVNPNVTIALNALDAKGRVRTLSTPKLLALEHEEAEVIIGDRIGYQVTTTINQVTTESVAFLESGVILRVRSFVDQSGRIMMEVHPEISTATVNNNIPSLSTTEVTTNFLAESGQTIFIAGLMRNSTSKRREGVPLLSDVPLFGRVFSNSEDITINTETVVMITPHIVDAGKNLFMTDTSKKVNDVESQLEAEKDKIEKKIEKKIGPVEIIESNYESKNDLGQTKTDEPLAENFAKTEQKKTNCRIISNDSISTALYQQCNNI